MITITDLLNKFIDYLLMHSAEIIPQNAVFMYEFTLKSV